MRCPLVLVTALCFWNLGLANGGGEERTIHRIAFGSCYRPPLSTSIWHGVRSSEPDLWIWLGDIIYGDSDQREKLRADYRAVAANPGYAALARQASVLGVWDDHDFGKNNAGKDWVAKEAAQQELLDFLGEPATSARRKQAGVYWSYTYGQGERKVKVMLIDVRYHRDDPENPQGDIFGAAQRLWIESELAGSDAALTIVASGTQVIPEEHAHEKWAQFPDARRWFFDRLVEHEPGAVIFISGDRHFAEISSYRPEGYPRTLYDLTSSSLNSSAQRPIREANRHRLGEPYSGNNFGLLEIDWEAGSVSASIRDEAGAVVLEQSVSLREL